MIWIRTAGRAVRDAMHAACAGMARVPSLSRDLNAILMMAPGVHPTGPAGAFSFGGSVTFENLFLWFFTSGRLRDESQGRTLIATTVPYEFREEQRRYEVKGTYSLNAEHRFQVNYNHHDRSQVNHSFNQNLTMDLRSLGTRRLPERLYAATYSGMISPATSSPRTARGARGSASSGIRTARAHGA